MKQLAWNSSLAVFVYGSLFGVVLNVILSDSWSNQRVAHAQETTTDKVVDLATLQQDIEILKAKVPDQAHSMMDVDYHYTNLWFAAQAENWALAEFYWNETMSHMRWAVRIIPVRKDSAGREIKLQEILQSIEQSSYMQVGKTIEEKDFKKFETAYRYTLEGCYSCHKASDKPYLRPQMPERPATQMINFNPNADWPR